jgi:hypothetical protein
LTYGASASIVCCCSMDLVLPHTTLPSDAVGKGNEPFPVLETSLTKQYAATSQVQYLNNHIRFITHEARQILLLDLSHCSATEVEKIFRAVPEVVTTRPRGSVLILSDFTGASIDQEATRVMKESAVFDKPYVRKSAWTGTESLPVLFSEELGSFSGREFPVFENRGEALTWLAKD